MIERSQSVAPHSKEIINDAMCEEKSLHLTRRFEPAHLPFAKSSRLMRHLNAIVGVTVSVMSDVGHDGSFGSTIAFELVIDDSKRFFALASQ
jgi:hypothetical protein